MQPLIVICGTTASGKSDLAVEVALRLNARIVSADSRQVFRGLDIGSGKITPAETRGIPHYGLDIVAPGEFFSVAHYSAWPTAGSTGSSRKAACPSSAAAPGCTWTPWPTAIR